MESWAEKVHPHTHKYMNAGILTLHYYILILFIRYWYRRAQCLWGYTHVCLSSVCVCGYTVISICAQEKCELLCCVWIALCHTHTHVSLYVCIWYHYMNYLTQRLCWSTLARILILNPSQRGKKLRSRSYLSYSVNAHIYVCVCVCVRIYVFVCILYGGVACVAHTIHPASSCMIRVFLSVDVAGCLRTNVTFFLLCKCVCVCVVCAKAGTVP